MGFKQATLAGLSFGITDLRIPHEKQALLDESQKKVDRVEKNYDRGIITAASGITSSWTSGPTAAKRCRSAWCRP